METAAHYLDKLAQATHRPEDELMADAYRVGLYQLCREPCTRSACSTCSGFFRAKR
jgi:hypothetical protein